MFRGNAKVINLCAACRAAESEAEWAKIEQERERAADLERRRAVELEQRLPLANVSDPVERLLRAHARGSTAGVSPVEAATVGTWFALKAVGAGKPPPTFHVQDRRTFLGAYKEVRRPAWRFEHGSTYCPPRPRDESPGLMYDPQRSAQVLADGQIVLCDGHEHDHTACTLNPRGLKAMAEYLGLE